MVAEPGAGAGVEPGARVGAEPAVEPGFCPVRAARQVLTRPARRRGKELENAIFEAALDQLTSGGYARLTMEGVASAARTGKAALYRRWASKDELVIDALDATLPRPSDTPDLGSARDELLQLVEGFTQAMTSRVGSALNALMGEIDHERAEVFKAFITDRVIEPTARTILEILRRGAERGDVRPGAATPLVADVIPAVMLYQVKIRGLEGVGPGFAGRLLDEVLEPMIRA
ncbi:TetR/AcrR family transcriptional regulator [Kitasatospora sp. NPDC101235]|uniref:TetR/AcrR family transcriptional regulator n=1 Tax=Kitasatospora sp. NPDC101235 TaxID=3364101 RepID=UPI0037F99235